MEPKQTDIPGTISATERQAAVVLECKDAVAVAKRKLDRETNRLLAMMAKSGERVVRAAGVSMDAHAGGREAARPWLRWAGGMTVVLVLALLVFAASIAGAAAIIGVMVWANDPATARALDAPLAYLTTVFFASSITIVVAGVVDFAIGYFRGAQR